MNLGTDTVATLQLAVALANTDALATRGGDDALSTADQLEALVERWGVTGRRDGDASELRDVRALRAEVRRLWMLPTDEMVPIVNRMLADGNARPWLHRHDGLGWHLHASELKAPLATRISIDIAMALIDIIRSHERLRLRICDAEDCAGVLVDLSRNGSKRYCSARCGNRMNMAAFRIRQD